MVFLVGKHGFSCRNKTKKLKPELNRLRGNISQFKKHEILSRDLNVYAKIAILNLYSP